MEVDILGTGDEAQRAHLTGPLIIGVGLHERVKGYLSCSRAVGF